jgi:hypothetical protein
VLEGHDEAEFWRVVLLSSVEKINLDTILIIDKMKWQ